MVTKHRPAFAQLAIDYFQQQLYPNRHLYILQNDTEPALVTKPVSNVTWDRCTEQLTVGMLRHRLVESTDGDIVMQWDDDDYYNQERIVQQAFLLAGRQADVSVMELKTLVDLVTWEGWQVTDYLLQQKQIALHVGTLCFRKALYTATVHYPNIQYGEDTAFLHILQEAYAATLKIFYLANRMTFVYIRHGTNSWQARPGTTFDLALWKQVPIATCFPTPDIVLRYRDLRDRVL
jgi:hypothetical protein